MSSNVTYGLVVAAVLLVVALAVLAYTVIAVAWVVGVIMRWFRR